MSNCDLLSLEQYLVSFLYFRTVFKQCTIIQRVNHLLASFRPLSESSFV